MQRDKDVFPIYDICNLNTDKNSNSLFSVDRFRGYVDSNPHLKHTHNHLYYHLVFFTEGSGEHLIDFETFPVKAGMIYFMKPGQVHQWKFEQQYDGYVINFNPNFWDWLGINSSILQQFSFYKSRNLNDQIAMLPQEATTEIIRLFEAILAEQQINDTFSNLKIANLLLELFIHSDRNIPDSKSILNSYQSVLIDNYLDLIELYFKEKKLPKEYAEILHVTPNHLNSLCKDVLGFSAGELIRKRVVLEAKRLLVDKELSVNEIAYILNFQDPSYFVKFYKKYTSFTPEQFRKNYYL